MEEQKDLKILCRDDGGSFRIVPPALLENKKRRSVMDKKKVNAAVEFFTRNPYWKKMYEEAPSDKCRERIALTFYYSTFFDEANADGTWAEAMKAAEDALKLEDWKYLLKYQGNNPGKLMIRKRIEELEEHSGDSSGT